MHPLGKTLATKDNGLRMLAPVIAVAVLVIPDLYMRKRETDRTV